MVLASQPVTREVPLMPGGRRLLGHAPEFGRDPLALLQRAREHGDVVQIRFGPFRVYLLNSPDTIRQALVGQARKLEKGLNFGRAKRPAGTCGPPRAPPCTRSSAAPWCRASCRSS